MAIPGDLVLHDSQDLVVVDVTDDGIAVLRRQDDHDLMDPVVAEAASLNVTGHLSALDGWVEDAPGEWRQA
jgi:hypothetical protein